MFQWKDVPEQTLFGISVKMYRDPFVGQTEITSEFTGIELDHHAYKYFENELFMYRIMDTNWDQFMEERGDVAEMSSIKIPTKQDTGVTIL